MRLTVVGCSGSFPGPDSPASCYLLEAEGFRLLLDLGNGALGALARHADIEAVDAVLLSHLHADHCLDLCAYYVARRYRPQGPLPPIPVLGPHRSGTRLARAYGMSEEDGMTTAFDFRTFPGTPFEVGPFTVRVARVAHPVEAYGMRLELGGKAITYSGDTGPCESLVDLSRGADLVLAEASFRDGDANPPDLHLTGKEAGEHAARAGADRLVVTHVPPWGDRDLAVTEASAVHRGPVEAARPGLVLEV